MSEQSASLARGAELTPETFADFVKRLQYHCRGEGVDDHCTASALFIVEARRFIYGIDPDYGADKAVIVDDQSWRSVQEYWDDCEDDERAELDSKMQDFCCCNFMEADSYSQWEVLGELENHTVTGWDERWEYVNAHFTKEAADAFIARKKHDYRDGLRVFVDSQYWCWEFEAIKNALMDGRLVLAEPKP